jgi:diacylglycerol kinase (ATP)
MRKLRLIYNPASGDTGFKHKLDSVIECFQTRGLQVIPHRSAGREDIQEAVRQVRHEDYYGIVAAGGDGTIHQVINAMAAEEIQVPLGIIPAGTANDLAAHFNISREIEQISTMVAAGQRCAIDVGQANDQFFVNVASSGLLTDVSHTIDIHFKNVFGKLAYYLKGVEQIPNFRPIPFQIESEELCAQEELFLFLVLNGSFAGGFANIAPALIDDGFLDVIAIRKCSLPHLISLSLKLLRGEHLYDRRILYFRTKEVTFRSLSHLDSDLDGEKGPQLPLHIKIRPHYLNVFVNPRMRRI